MEAVIFVGIQGSGKSTFYRERFFDTHIRLSLDVLRTRAREGILLRACLAARQPFVVDNTNVRAGERAVYIEAAKAAGFQAVCYYFDSELRAAIRRNSRREGKKKIPVAGVIGTFKRLEPPSLREGFDSLYIVRIDENNRFAVSSEAPASGGPL